MSRDCAHEKLIHCTVIAIFEFVWQSESGVSVSTPLSLDWLRLVCKCWNDVYLQFCHHLSRIWEIGEASEKPIWSWPSDWTPSTPPTPRTKNSSSTWFYAAGSGCAIVCAAKRRVEDYGAKREIFLVDPRGNIAEIGVEEIGPHEATAIRLHGAEERFVVLRLYPKLFLADFLLRGPGETLRKTERYEVSFDLSPEESTTCMARSCRGHRTLFAVGTDYGQLFVLQCGETDSKPEMLQQFSVCDAESVNLSVCCVQFHDHGKFVVAFTESRIVRFLISEDRSSASTQIFDRKYFAELATSAGQKLPEDDCHLALRAIEGHGISECVCACLTYSTESSEDSSDSDGWEVLKRFIFALEDTKWDFLTGLKNDEHDGFGETVVGLNGLWCFSCETYKLSYWCKGTERTFRFPLTVFENMTFYAARIYAAGDVLFLVNNEHVWRCEAKRGNIQVSKFRFHAELRARVNGAISEIIPYGACPNDGGGFILNTGNLEQVTTTTLKSQKEGGKGRSR